nr:MAG TPA: Penicillin-insensitive murein endopeptidase [Caudoviricetes sp.]
MYLPAASIDIPSPAARRWTLAPALVALRDEVNARWPGRDKSSDGTIGDLAHQRGVSEHNPDLEGVVRAIDITARGIDVDALLNAAIGDPRVHYVIYRGRICSRTYGWTWRPSSGHEHHIHISLRNRTSESAPWETVHRAASDTSRWFKGSTQEEDMPLTDGEFNRIASTTWGAQFGDASDTAKGRLGTAATRADAAASWAYGAMTQTAPIHRPGDPAADSNGDVSLRQEIADSKTLALENRQAIKDLGSKIDQILAALGGDRA